MSTPRALLLLLATVSTSAPVQSQTSSAQYELSMLPTWSATSHPGAYPSNAHFSRLVGGTHAVGFHFWQDGGFATLGIEQMAETGSWGPVTVEVNAAITAGNAGEVVLGETGGFDSPGPANVTTLTVTDEFPLVTYVTMIAPSPDWFIGVDGVNLFENGYWVDQKVVQLYAWDAGTDSGPGFTSSNSDTNPQQPISLMTTGPFFGNTPLGTLTFTRLTNAQTYCVSKITSQGCVPDIVHVGQPSLTSPVPFTVAATAVPNNKIGTFFYSVTGRAATPFAGGTLCLQPTFFRTSFLQSGGTSGPDDCSGVLQFGFNTFAQTGNHPELTPGSVVRGQFWFRDPNHSDGTGVGLSNAIEFQLGN